MALRGDPPAGSIEPWSGDYEYAYKLVKQINYMNQGKYLPLRPDLDYRDGVDTDFCILVAGHPEDPIDKEIEHIKKKVEAGAEAIITQMIFSEKDYVKYVSSLRKAGITIPVLPGIRPLTTLKQAESVEKFFNLPVNDELKKGLKEQGEEFGIRYFSKMVKKLRMYGAPGVHLFILNDVELVEKIIENVKSVYS